MKKIMTCLLAFVLLFSLTGCAARTPVDPEELTAAAEELGLTVTQTSESDLAESGLTAHLTATSDETNCQLFVFADEATAQNTYAQLLSMIQQNGATKPEKQVNTSTYSKYFVESDGVYCTLVRINTSVFYGEDKGDDGTLKTLVEKIGYK